MLVFVELKEEDLLTPRVTDVLKSDPDKFIYCRPLPASGYRASNYPTSLIKLSIKLK